MGVPVLHTFSVPDWEEEHGRFITKQVEGPALKIKKLAEEITGEHPDWTDEEVKAELRKRLRCPREET